MSLTACAALVERADPDRFWATMAAPIAARARLWPLYAYNLEIARAPWASAEPMVAEMRLQWWVDTAAAMGKGAAHKAHEVAGPLAALVEAAHLPSALLESMAEARRRDVWGAPFADDGALMAYLDATAGSLMWAAALALGAQPPAEPMVRDFGACAGLAAYLRAVPDLVAHGRVPLPDPSEPAIATLARAARLRMRAARKGGGLPRAAHPALWPGWQAERLLRQAERAPGRVAAGALGLSEFTRRAGLLRRVWFGGF